MSDAAAISLRSAKPSDEHAVRELVFSVLREHGLEPDPETTDRDLATLPSAYRGGAFDVLIDGGEIVGTVGLMPKSGGSCELRKMYLKASHRGRGLGKKLLEHALERARALGFRVVELETASPLERAISMYERRGFRPVPEHELSSRCDQAYRLELD